MAYKIEPFQGSDLSVFLDIGLHLWLLILNPSDSLSAANLFAARLERSSFCRSKAEAKKREWKAEKAAQNQLISQNKSSVWLNFHIKITFCTHFHFFF
jgi:hypothetical protein